jgi:pyridoxine kinase
MSETILQPLSGALKSAGGFAPGTFSARRRRMSVLSIHSQVALGHVGNSGAAFALQRLGLDVWPIATVVLSNHPAHGRFRGRTIPPADMSELLHGLRERGTLNKCAAIVTGYLGDPGQGAVVLDAIAAVRAANPHALYLLDPIMGDHGRCYVKAGIPEFLRDRALPQADIITPNGYELEFLAGRAPDTTHSALAAIDIVRARSPKLRLVVATGLALEDRPPGDMSMLAVDPAGVWRLAVPAVDHPAHGAGDVFAALLLGRLLLGDDTPAALSHAASAVHAVVAHSAAGSADLALIPCQDELAGPRRRFIPERLR